MLRAAPSLFRLEAAAQFWARFESVAGLGTGEGPGLGPLQKLPTLPHLEGGRTVDAPQMPDADNV